ncbi:cation/H(+) antiporter 11-like [Hibiscus syriacus]|uniref:cation/H(+) antiporter 11-like n=1 Tax=Hibiscus syriacus TaxID=106335 RepID=UPI0019204E3F|nr:cation/H(+) antiporter 11-like [Hibiscus syriacus]
MAGPPPPPPPFSFGNGTFEVCMALPPKINSVGIWENQTSPSVILTYSLPLLELQMLLIFTVTHLVYGILKPLGITLFASQMFAGMIMGPAVLGKIESFRDIFIRNELVLQVIDTTAGFGFCIFSFLMGVKMDARLALKTTRRAVVIGIVSLLCPLLVSIIVQEIYKTPNQSERITIEYLVGVVTQSVTHFSVVAWLLGELNILNSELGRLALSAAAVSDLSNIFLYKCFTLAGYWKMSPSLAVGWAGATIFYLFLLFCVFRPWMFWVIRTTPEGRPVKGVYVVIIMMLAFAYGVFTHWLDRSPLLGAFLVGLAVPDGPPLGSTMVEKFDGLANGVFLVIYVTTSTMRVNPTKMLADLSRVRFTCILVIATFLAKFISCLIASCWSRIPIRDSLAFSLIMSSKGIVELSYFSSYKDSEVLSDETFSMLTLVVLVNATIIPILVKYLYDPVSRKYASYQQRNIMHLKPNSELRILACVHRPEHVSALVDVLNITYPTKESPNVVYALHLIELVGRDSPVFIAHQKHKNLVVNSYHHIVAFNQYEKNNWETVTVNAFTAISPSKLMHEDVCTLALDKEVSFILLPFHRKWSVDGSIEDDNNVIRNMNCNVLDRAPCSTGILVDRRRKLFMSSTSTYSVGMIFLGGKDDREALTLAKRIARDPKVKLTVIHLIADEDSGNFIDWDGMLDAEVLKDIKQNDNSHGCDVKYIVLVSKHGQQASRIVQSIVGDYDLIIVGRRYGADSVQTMGLSDWSEFPELGVIGDLLVSPDLNCRISVLVVQQQDFIDS